MAFTPSEFSLSIRYRHPNAGSYPRVTLPGFYLQAGFANEGEASWVYEQRLLSPQALLAIAREIDLQLVNTVQHPGVVSNRESGPLAAVLDPIAETGRKELEAAKAAAKRAIEENVARLEQIEGALKDA